MSSRLSKTELKRIYLFSISSYNVGLGHKLRCNKLKKNLIDKKHKVKHFNLDIKIKSLDKDKIKYFNKIFLLSKKLNSIIILDISNKYFLKKKDIDILRTQFLFNKNIFIIDDPIIPNLSSKLNLKKIKYIFPYDLNTEQKRKLKGTSKKAIGFKYFIHYKNEKKKLNSLNKKNKKILITFGGSDLKHKTEYVLNLIKDLKLNSRFKIEVILGKYFKKTYENRIKKLKNIKNLSLSKFQNKIDYSKINYLITNSGLTKYEALFYDINIIIFSDTKKSLEMDQIFSSKYNHTVFSYKKNNFKDKNRLKSIFTKDKKIIPKKYSFNSLYKFILSDE